MEGHIPEIRRRNNHVYKGEGAETHWEMIVHKYQAARQTTNRYMDILMNLHIFQGDHIRRNVEVGPEILGQLLMKNRYINFRRNVTNSPLYFVIVNRQ